MAGRDTARTIFGYIGAGTTLGLLFSPVHIFLNIVRNRDVGQQSVAPYLATLGNCVVWFLYGSVSPNSAVVVGINTIGAVIEMIYVGIYFRFSVEAQRRRLSWWLGAEAFAIALVMGVGFILEGKSTWFGWIGLWTGIAMYISPMFNVWTVIQTRNVEHMSLLLSSVSLANSVCWLIYSTITKFDVYIFTPNLVGVVCALVQLFVYAFYSYYGGNAMVN